MDNADNMNNINNEFSDNVFNCATTFGAFAGLANSAYTFNQISGQGDDSSKEGIENQIKLIEEETKELREGFEAGSTVEILDACIDILYVTYGLILKLEITCDIDAAMKQVHDDNFKKFFNGSEYQLAEETKDWHCSKGKKARVSKSSYGVYAVLDENNKVLKPIDFVSTDLTKFVMEDHREL